MVYFIGRVREEQTLYKQMTVDFYGAGKIHEIIVLHCHGVNDENTT